MPAQRKYPDELKARAVRLVFEAREQDEKLTWNAAVARIGQRVGVVPATLRGWCKQAAIDSGQRPGRSTAEAAEIKELRQRSRGAETG